MTTNLIRKKHGASSIMGYIVISVLLFISLSFLITGAVYVSSNWVLTTGTVIFNNPDLVCTGVPNSSLYDCSFTVRYKVVQQDGSIKWYFVKIKNIVGPRVQRGDKVYLQYDPNDYSRVLYGNTSYKTYGLLYLTFGLILLLLAVYYWTTLNT